MRNRVLLTVCRAAAAALLCFAAGCAMPHKVAVNDAGVPQYQEMHVSYRIPGSHRALTQHVDGIVRASAEADDDGSADPTAAMLTIEYPHPQKKADGARGEADSRRGASGYNSEVARATLRISSEDVKEEPQSFIGRVKSGISWLPGTAPPAEVAVSPDDEVWELDVPRYQLDLMLVDIAQGGFFDDINRHEGTVYLNIRIDRGGVAKTWSPEARLDDLALRVQREGWRVSSGRSGERRASAR